MRAREGCGLLALGFLFMVVACLVFVALAGAMVLTGEVPLHAPYLTAFQPEPGYPFRPTTPITLTFDQMMDVASVEAAFSLEPAVPGAFHWNQDRTQVVFVPSAPGYETGTAYTIRLLPGMKAGTLPRLSERGKEWRFELAPLLERLSPLPEAEGLGAWTQLEAAFNYPLDCDLTLPAFTVVPQALGQLECRDQTLVFRPVEPLAPGISYAASFEHVYLEGDPTPRPGVRWSLQTAPPLAAVGVLPETATPLVDLWSPIRITFNRPVVTESAVSRFRLIDPDGSEVSGDLTWEEEGARFLFQPDRPLRPDSTYRLVLDGGVRDGLGFALDEALASSFQTAPMVGMPLPTPGAADVALDSAVRIPFTRPMDRPSVEAGLTFTPTVDGIMSWDEDTLVVSSRGGLSAETVYEAVLGPDVRDASGAPLGRASHWTFETQAFLLDANVPADIELMELGQAIEFTFALPMDRARVQAALSISPATPGELSWSNEDRTLRFQPDPAWLAGAEYEIRLDRQARTAGGLQMLGEDHAWRFSTGVAQVQFGEGPNVQVMDAAGERTFQFSVQGADVADFVLHAITRTQFLDLYSSGFRGIGPQEPQIVATAGLSVTVAWREPVLLGDDQPYDGALHTAEARIPADVPPGLYVLAAGPPSGDRAQLILVVSQHALVLKRALTEGGGGIEPLPPSHAQILVWDTEISGGMPVVSATVSLYGRDGAFVAQGQTDEAGLLTLEVPGDPEPLLALSEKDGDITICGLGREWREGGWQWWWSEPPSRLLYTTYSYTDRPIYRPGQTIYYKDVIRADDDVSYTLPGPDLPVTVRLRDARDNVAATQVLTPTEFGTVHGAFQLAEEPMLGLWNVETEVAGTVTRQPVKVEEYRKPDYGVTVGVPRTAYIQGETISVTVDAAYYFGEPVGDAEVVLNVYPSYPDVLFGEEESRFGYPISTERGRTDTQGRWSVALPTDGVLAQDGASYAMLALEATVTDGSGQRVSNYQTVFVHRNSQRLSILLEKHGYGPEEEIAFSVQVRDLDGRPVAGAELMAVMQGWDEDEVATASAATDARGQAHFSVALAEQGWYRLRLTGIDSQAMEAEEWLWVYDPSGQAPWYGGQWGKLDGLSITADRATYAVGDTAQLVIYTPVPGRALLSFERGETHHVEPITLVSGTNLISVPVRADYAPNIHVAVNQFGPPGTDWLPEQSWPEAELHTATTQLLVPMTDRLLTVTLTSDMETYAAGEQALFQVQVVDSQGEPVVAEVSLAVVDEAIYALAEDLSRDPFAVFYAPRPNLVRTFDSLRPSRWLYPERGLGGAGDGEVGGAPRRAFLDTAHWAPTVVTDGNGEATIRFALPDNLTEWRAIARAVTTDTLVGEATTHIVVSQDIVVQPALPRFVVQGDAFTLTAVVHNFTERGVSATVALEAEGLVLAEDGGDGAETEQHVDVPAGGSTVVGWPVVAGWGVGDAPGEGLAEARVEIRATAMSGGARLAGRDAVELTLPIYPLAVPEVAVFAGTLTPAQPTETLTVPLPADAIEGLSRLEINLAPSIAPGLLDGLEYLIDYPFGCVEQTMSRVLPNAMVARAFRRLGVESELLEADLPPMVDLGLQKLYGFQHNDGGWGWWYDDSTDVNQTAYVLLGLAMTEQGGYDIDQAVIDRGAEALGRMLPSADLRSQAYGAYVLTTAGRPVTIAVSLTDALDLDLFSQAALATALEATGHETMTTALLDNLREAAIQDASTVHWTDEGDDVAYRRKVMGSTVRTTALLADALVRLDPESPLLPKATQWLMDQRQGLGWGDTQKTSFAILALTDYLLASGELASGAAFRVYVNDVLWQEGLLDQAQAGQTLVLTYSQALSPALWLPAVNHVVLALGAEGEAATGRLYYAATASMSRSPDEGVVPAQLGHERSIGVQREYRLQGSEEAEARFERGDLVEVRLTLDVPEESWYVVVDDPLPAGFEAINERLGTTSHIAIAYAEPVYTWQEHGYNRKDVRDERVVFFVTHLEPGLQTLSYLVRATTAGSFAALPTQVYPMYEPEVWSRSGSARCEIGPR